MNAQQRGCPQPLNALCIKLEILTTTLKLNAQRLSRPPWRERNHAQKRFFTSLTVGHAARTGRISIGHDDRGALDLAHELHPAGLGCGSDGWVSTQSQAVTLSASLNLEPRIGLSGAVVYRCARQRHDGLLRVSSNPDDAGNNYHKLPNEERCPHNKLQSTSTVRRRQAPLSNYRCLACEVRPRSCPCSGRHSCPTRYYLSSSRRGCSRVLSTCRSWRPIRGNCRRSSDRRFRTSTARMNKRSEERRVG